MAHPHPLDRPVWHALATRQAALARGDAQARRLAADYGPLAAAADRTPAAQAALLALIPPDGELWLVETADFPVPAGTVVRNSALCHQMILAGTRPAAAPGFVIEPLGEADGSEMHALASLTEPGPFAEHTHRFGGFLGVRHGGRLVAMAGERLKPEGFAEVSGVCTHPDHRGQGYAAGLMRAVMAAIVARGETPFLHVYAANTHAVSLYETLGFTIRSTLTKTVIARA